MACLGQYRRQISFVIIVLRLSRISADRANKCTGQFIIVGAAVGSRAKSSSYIRMTHSSSGLYYLTTNTRQQHAFGPHMISQKIHSIIIIIKEPGNANPFSLAVNNNIRRNWIYACSHSF